MAAASLFPSIKFAALSIAKVLVICSLGYLLASRRVGILSPSGNKLLSKLVFAVFLPCLIITQLGDVFTLEKLIQWWFIPVNVLLASIIGCIIAYVVVLIIRPPPEFIKFTIVMIGVGNIGNVPLVLISSVCRDPSKFFGDMDSCYREGVAYISFGQWVGTIIVYTFAYHMLSPPKERVCDDTYMPIDGGFNDDSMNDEENIGDEHHIFFLRKGRKWLKKTTMKLQQLGKMLHLRNIFQPPVSCSILALIIGATPTLRNLLLADGAPLSFLTDSMHILGNAMIPCILLALGGNLRGGPGGSELGFRTTIAITVTRLFIIPPVGIGVVLLAGKFGLIPVDNKIFLFVLLLQYTMPSSILAGAIAAMRGVAEKEAASVLFYEHLVAIVSVTLWLILYFNILL